MSSFTYDLAVLMRAMVLAENKVRILDPEFQLLASLHGKAPAILKAAMGQTEMDGALDLLKLDASTAMHDLPAVLGSWMRRLSREGEGFGLSLRVHGLRELEERLDRTATGSRWRSSRSASTSQGSLLMQHSLGPRIFGDLPILAAILLCAGVVVHVSARPRNCWFRKV
jgi:ubiquinone biosynthesis protein